MWMLIQGFIPDNGHHGKIEQFATKNEALAAAALQASCDRWNGCLVEGSTKTGYLVNNCIYVKVVHSAPEINRITLFTMRGAK